MITAIILPEIHFKFYVKLSPKELLLTELLKLC